MAAARDGPSCSTEVAQSTSASLTGHKIAAAAALADCGQSPSSSQSATSSRVREKMQPKSQSSSSIRLDRIESGVNQIIALLVKQKMETHNVSAASKTSAAEAQSAGSLTDGRDPFTAVIASACLPSSRRASRDNLAHDCLACDSPKDVRAAAAAAEMWRGCPANLQATVEMLASRLASQAALLDARIEEARREREEATDERLELLRRLDSFRRQLDVNQAARARLHVELESTKAELARLKQQGGGGRGGSQDLEETVVALTTQLDLSNQQLIDIRDSRDSLRRRAEQLQVLLQSGGVEGGLVRSCSCDQRLHECCRRGEDGRGDGLGKVSLPPLPLPLPQSRQAVSDHGGNMSEPSGGLAGRPSSLAKKSFRKRLLRRKKSKIEESDD